MGKRCIICQYAIWQTTIHSWTLDRFKEAKEKLEQVTTRTLQQRAIAAAQQFLSDIFKFKAQETLVNNFKRINNIQQRITNGTDMLLTEEEVEGMDKVLAAADQFRKQIKPLLQNFHPDLIINTDQTGCQYQSTIDRTLKQKSEICIC